MGGTRAKLSENGLAFLKCAFASPDFSVDPGKGIPDQFHGRTLSIKDCFTTAVSFTPATDTYIIQAPVPGYAYFKAEVPIGADPIKFQGVPFPTYDTNFGDGSDSQNKFSKFRYASLASGVYPTSNMMQFSGSIQVWRVDLNLAEALTPSDVATPGVDENSRVGKRIQGLQGIIPLAPRDNYSDSFIKGAYTFAFDKSQDFTWQDFCIGVSYDERGDVIPVPATTRQLVCQVQGNTRRLQGLGNTNTIVYKISTPTGAVNTAILRFWNCIELQADTNSALFQFTGVSPPHDPVALELYHNLKMRFPVAVPCSENSKFWDTVLRAIEQASKIGMLFPGPAGLISGGINTIASAIQGQNLLRSFADFP
uniref:nodavirus endopeptidase n=1 Tax=Caninovirus sp. TaxID=2022010 RepID=A0A221LEB2_9VIRU|nr:capsid [Caninovirus sp.]